jgi:hypothetical protein
MFEQFLVSSFPSYHLLIKHQQKQCELVHGTSASGWRSQESGRSSAIAQKKRWAIRLFLWATIDERRGVMLEFKNVKMIVCSTSDRCPAMD